MLKSPYRFPYCFKDYLNPKHYYYYGKHLYQRMRYGVSEYDMFNFDNYLLDVLKHALPTFKNVNSSYIVFHLPEDIEVFTEYPHLDDSAEQRAMDRWDKMIDTILDGMNMPDSSFDWTSEDYEKLQTSFSLLGRHLPALWT